MSYDSQQMANASILMANAAGLQAEVAGMEAENLECILSGTTPTYKYGHFQGVIEKYGCDHNSIITTLGINL